MVYPETMEFIFIDGCIVDPVILLIHTNAPRHTINVHARVGVATPTQWIISLKGAILELAVPSHPVYLDKDLMRADF